MKLHNTIKLLLLSIPFYLFCSTVLAEKSTVNLVRNSIEIERILVLGDSLSAAHNLPRNQGWVALFKQHLQAQALNIDINNASVSGATTAAGLQRLPALLATYQPDLVILELGANDGLQGKPLNYIKQNLVKLIEPILKTNAKILLLGIRLPPNLGRRYTEPFFKQYQTLANTYKISIVPFMLEGVAGNAALMKSDGLHPNKEGQQKVFEYLWPSLKQAIQ